MSKREREAWERGRLVGARLYVVGNPYDDTDDSEPVPFVRELTDEEIVSVCRAEGFGVLVGGPACYAIRQCIALATKLPDGAIRWTEQLVAGSTVDMRAVCARPPMPDGTRGTIHMTFIPDTKPTKRVTIGGQELDATEAELREALVEFERSET